jgi:Tripartite tricarboxylate transporter family receptor
MRALSPAMERQLGQQIVIESRPGSAGTIGVRDVARAKPDGYTLLLGTTNNFVINQFMFPKQAFDPLGSLAYQQAPVNCSKAIISLQSQSNTCQPIDHNQNPACRHRRPGVRDFQFGLMPAALIWRAQFAVSSRMN